jgi:predicted phosphodiesterase
MFVAQKIYTTTRRPNVPEPIIKPVTVICISDTHNSQTDIPDGDILIHAGDLTQSGSFDELQQTIDWLRRQPHQHKIAIAGNHDLLLDDSLEHLPSHTHDTRTCHELEWGGITYLQDSSVTLVFRNGRRLLVYGSPKSPQYGNWPFQYPRSQDVWTGAVPNGTDILVTHGPPRAHLDLLKLGCPHLLSEVWRVRPALHIFGHVHEGYGQEWLYYDGVQAAFERMAVAGGGLWRLAEVLKEALLWCWRPMRTPSTLLVNPAMTGGFGDEKKRRPVVVTI